MKKCPVILLLFFISSVLVYGFNEDVHNKHLLRLLFGSIYTNIYGFGEDTQKKITALNQSVYWCVDEFNGTTYNNGQARRYLEELKQFGVRNVPRFEDIDFNSNSYHQRYTHLGWEWNTYPVNRYAPSVNKYYNQQEIWGKRKLLLLDTVDKIFNFRNNEKIKQDSFSALIYYAHILGDHIGDKKSTLPDRIPITRRNYTNVNYTTTHETGSPSIYSELLWHIPRLFREQELQNSSDYSLLMKYLKENKNKQLPQGTTMSDEEYVAIASFANETLVKLIEYIPRLLKNEAFFTRSLAN